MRKRLLRFLLALLVIALVCFLLTPMSRYRVMGVLRGENFYQGRPTSYWRGIVKDWEVEFKQTKLSWAGGQGLDVQSPPPPPPTLTERLSAFVSNLWSSPVLLPPEGEVSEAIPVLVDLLDDEDADVRTYAARSLCNAGSKGERAIPRLTQLLEDDSPEVRRCAFVGMAGIRRNPEFVVPLSLKMLKDKEPFVRERAVNELRVLGEAAKSAVPALREALNDEDEGVRGQVKHTLKAIEP